MDVENVSVVPVRTDLFDVIYRGAVPTEKEFLLKLLSDDFSPRSFNFKVLRDENVIETFSLNFQNQKFLKRLILSLP